jgi:hypothetical protein
MAEGMSRYKSVLFVLGVIGSVFGCAAEARVCPSDFCIFPGC